MDPFPKRIPRAPGAWMLRALVQRYLATVIIGASGLGAIMLWIALGAIPAPAATVATGLLLAWGAACVASLLVVRHGFRNYGEESLEKGFAAETLIGRRIEAAITRPNHAVAHNVLIKGAEPGDIDHLVATPRGLVVVESKFADVPQDKFPGVRRRLAKNIKAVRAWAPPDTPVRGAIVYMHLNDHSELEYPTLGEDIRVYRSERFAKEFRADLGDEAVFSHVQQVRDEMFPK